MTDAMKAIADNYTEKIKAVGDTQGDRNKRSVKNLYRQLRKNARSVDRFGEEVYPKLAYKKSMTDGHMFSKSRYTSEAFNDVLPFINSIISSKADGKSPCLSMRKERDDGEVEKTLPEIIHALNGDTSKLSEYAPTKRIGLQLRHCKEPHCDNCQSCAVHRDELENAVHGVVAAGPENDELRNLHMKNVITTLFSMYHHHNDRGNVAETANDPSYDKDSYPHLVLGTKSYLAANHLQEGYERDNQETGGAGGGKHNDTFETDAVGEGY